MGSQSQPRSGTRETGYGSLFRSASCPSAYSPEIEWVFINKPISIRLNKVCMKNKLTHLCVNNMIRNKISADRQGLFDTVFNQSWWAFAASEALFPKSMQLEWN